MVEGRTIGIRWRAIASPTWRTRIGWECLSRNSNPVSGLSPTWSISNASRKTTPIIPMVDYRALSTSSWPTTAARAMLIPLSSPPPARSKSLNPHQQPPVLLTRPGFPAGGGSTTGGGGGGKGSGKDKDKDKKGKGKGKDKKADADGGNTDAGSVSGKGDGKKKPTSEYPGIELSAVPEGECCCLL